MGPLEKLDIRLSSLIDQAEAGEPIDWAKEAEVTDMEIARAGVHYASEAIQRTKQEDEQLTQRSA